MTRAAVILLLCLAACGDPQTAGYDTIVPDASHARDGGEPNGSDAEPDAETHPEGGNTDADSGNDPDGADATDDGADDADDAQRPEVAREPWSNPDPRTPPALDPYTPRDEPIWPIPVWTEGSARAHGFDVAQLERARAYSESVGGKCLLVVHDGELVYESYYNGSDATTLHRGWSLAKTFTAVLVGLAIQHGFLGGVDDPAANYIPEWVDSEYEPITLHHLLSMTSGLYYDLLQDNLWAVFTQDMTAEAVGYGIDAPPGQVWHYSNHGVQVLEAVLRNASGMDVEAFAWEYLWGPLGFQDDTFWERDGAGHPTLFMNVNLRCRDLARLGYLRLQQGRWGDEQLLDPAWTATMTTPSQDLNRIYGYFWWLNGGTPAIDATDDPFEGTMFDDAPAELISAQGIGQNFCDVLPSRRTLFIHMRPAPHDPIDNLFTDFQGTLDRMFRDGKQIEHRALLELLLPALPR